MLKCTFSFQIGLSVLEPGLSQVATAGESLNDIQRPWHRLGLQARGVYLFGRVCIALGLFSPAMRPSVVSFLGSTVGSSSAPTDMDMQGLHQKVQALHDFVEGSFRQQAKLLRELRRARRCGASGSWELRLGHHDKNQASQPEEDMDVDRSLQLEAEEDVKEGQVSEANQYPAVRPSVESILARPARYPGSETSGQSTPRPSLASATGRSGRFALRLSADGATSRKAKPSIHSVQSSRTTQSSSKSSFLGQQYRSHLTAARVEASRQQRRRAASDDSPQQDEPTWPAIQRLATRTINSSPFSGVLTLLILLHVVLMGVEVDAFATSDGEQVPRWFGVANLVLVSLFVAEMLLKFAAFGCKLFFFGSDWAWNAFDFFVIALSVLDVILGYALISSGQVRVFRILRIFRYLRTIRVVRLFRYISALRVLTLSILGTMSSFLWHFVGAAGLHAMQVCFAS
eukprot:s1305_g22.t1